MKHLVAVVLIVLSSALPAGAAGMRITEYMYNGLGTGSIGEFVEFTNTGTSAIDLTGWSFDDNTRTPGSQSLSAFGMVQPGESVILTDNTAAAFRTAWNLAASVKIIGGNTNNLGRADEINLYDNNSTPNLVDRLTYDDQTIAGSIRTNGVSGWSNDPVVLGANNIVAWHLSSVGDAQGSFTSSAGEIGSPGTFVPAPVPEPGAVMSIGLAALGGAWRLRRRAAAMPG